MEPITRKETYLAKAAGDDVSIPEPITREEKYLSKIAQGGGGGGGATSVTLTASGSDLSGDVSLADLKTALANGVVLLSFPTDGNADERVVAEYTDDSTNGLRIGVFSEDEYIIYSVVDDGNDGVTLTVESKTNTNPYYDYTPTAAEGRAFMTAFQSFLAAGAQSAGTYMKQKVSGDFTGVTTAAYDAYASGKTLRVLFGLSQDTMLYCVPSTYGNNGSGSGALAISIPYSGVQGGVTITSLINILTFIDNIVLMGAVFVG